MNLICLTSPSPTISLLLIGSSRAGLCGHHMHDTVSPASCGLRKSKHTEHREHASSWICFSNSCYQILSKLVTVDAAVVRHVLPPACSLAGRAVATKRREPPPLKRSNGCPDQYHDAIFVFKLSLKTSLVRSDVISLATRHCHSHCTVWWSPTIYALPLFVSANLPSLLSFLTHRAEKTEVLSDDLLQVNH